MIAIILLITLGLVLLVLEISVLMGSIKFGIMGLILLVIGIYLSYSQFGVAFGNTVLVSSLLFGMVLLVGTFRYLSRNKVGLEKVLEGKVNEASKLNVSVGDTGIAFGDLRLSGRIDINGSILDAESNGDYIDDGTKVMVTKITENQVFVVSVNEEKYSGKEIEAA